MSDMREKKIDHLTMMNWSTDARKVQDFVNGELQSAGFNMCRPINWYDDLENDCRVFRQNIEDLDPKPVETNQEHFFGDRLISDTIMLLTYENHQRAECRLFKKELSRMVFSGEIQNWLKSPKDNRFNW